jgi:uncharacterized protein (TIGR00661 family)
MGMKVLIGVCGHGYGHSSRQLEIARRLVSQGCQVRILTFGKGYDFFAHTEFHDRRHEVFVPWIDCAARGIRWARTLRLNWRDAVPGLLRNRRVFAALRRDGFRPDVCVSDYEPVTAWLARRLRIPLVTVDQQSKFLGFQIGSLAGMSREEERSRLAVFFPVAAKRIATSFYRVDVPRDPRFDVELLPPIIRHDVAALVDRPRPRREGLVLVYLSSYMKVNSFVELTALTGVLARKSQWRFRVYSQEVTSAHIPFPNVEVRPTLGKEFLDDLAGACALVCTAGHTLLSEAMALGVPVLTVPLFTYDQHLCAQVISEAGVGLGVPEISERALDEFLSRLDEFRAAIAHTPKLLRGDTDRVLTRICEQIAQAGIGV